MIKESVLIILNEREPLKQQMALELGKQLAGRAISHERIKPSANLSKIITERAPAVLVLDYLLGDFGTALDILTDFSEASGKTPPQTIIWTDEPSVSVAVSAMKLGAKDYVELSTATSLERVLEAVDKCLRENADAVPQSSVRRRAAGLDELVGQDRVFQDCLAIGESVAERGERVVVILGATGSGKNALGRFIHTKRRFAGGITEIDFDSFSGDVAEIVGSDNQTDIPLLSYGETLIIDHAEFDTGELLDAVERRSKFIWTNDSLHPPMLIIGTCSPDCAKAWVKLAQAQLIEIPLLKDRPADLLPLIQRFALEISGNARAQRAKFSAELIEHLSELEWGGNVRQFRAACIEAMTIPMEADGKSDDGREAVSEQKGKRKSRLTKNDQLIFRAVLSAKLRWERYQHSEMSIPQAIAARQAIDNAEGNIRIAAARLGTGIPQLRASLKGGERPTGYSPFTAKH